MEFKIHKNVKTLTKESLNKSAALRNRLLQRQLLEGSHLVSHLEKLKEQANSSSKDELKNLHVEALEISSDLNRMRLQIEQMQKDIFNEMAVFVVETVEASESYNKQRGTELEENNRLMTLLTKDNYKLRKEASNVLKSIDKKRRDFYKQSEAFRLLAESWKNRFDIMNRRHNH